MTVVLSQFVRSLTESGLMSADEIEAFVKSLPEDKKPQDGAALAKELVRQKRLTRFQARAVYQGKTKLILGDYVILDQIGQGGMGQVFKARHRVMKRIVALKTLPSAATKTERAVRRFHREVEVAARLSHPNIVTAYDARESQGIHFLVMEHVEGGNLASVVRQQGRLPVGMAVDYVIQAARGLEYAHKTDVIHRDIKPSNLLLNSEGTVKVLDMGLARLNKAIGSTDPTAEETLTETGQAMGTIDYMPPEQAENTKNVDERADIYSLGCTLFYLLSGNPVYEGDTPVVKLMAHREAPIPSLRAERGDVPERLDNVFQKMVAKKPGDRYGSMTDVVAELEACVLTPPEPPPLAGGLAGVPLSAPQAPTQPAKDTEEVPADDDLRLDMSVAPPVHGVPQAKPKEDRQEQIVIGSILATFLLVFLIVVGSFITRQPPHGTLVVEVNEPDAVVQVMDLEGEVEFSERSDGGRLSIPLDPGRHRLKVEKEDFTPFIRKFEMESGSNITFPARLEPLPPELRPLQRYIGSWEHQVVQKPTEGNAERTETTIHERIDWILGGRMIEGNAIYANGTRSMMYISYDDENAEYRHWRFDSTGSMPRGEQSWKWYEATQSFIGNTTNTDGNTLESVLRFIDRETMDWTSLGRDATGEIIFAVEGKGKRKSTLVHLDVKEQDSKAPPAEMKVLQRMVGTWQSEGVHKVAGQTPVKIHTTNTEETILGGHFVRSEASDNDGKVLIVSIRTFDVEQQAYRQWLFDCNGSIIESSGHWDEVANTLTLTDEGQGITGVATNRFSGDDTIEWSYVSKDGHGKVHIDFEGKSTRQK